MSAERYLARGFAPIPLLRGSKAPRLPGWPTLRFERNELAAHFPEGGNIGLLLGEPSGGLVDVDLDCPEALRLASAFLPPTAMRHGRTGKPGSHWFFRCDDPPAPAKFSAPDGTCLVELRSTGQQTIVPPSVHPSGEVLTWESEGEPATISAAVLFGNVSRLAAAALLLRNYPNSGSRNEFCLALAGLVLCGGMSAENAGHLIHAVAGAAGDEEAHARAAIVQSTRQRLNQGQPVRGGKHLAAMLGSHGQQFVSCLRRWLSLETAVAPAKLQQQSTSGALLELREAMELFHDPEGRAYASVQVADHLETWPLRSRDFALYLRRQHFGTARSAVGSEALKSAIETFESDALFSGPSRPVYVRVAAHAGTYWLDLANERWEAVEIRNDGWRVCASPQVKFIRPRGMLPMTAPQRGGSFAELRPFVNVATDEDWILLACWLLAALRPMGPYPVAALYGEHGSAKSTTARVLRSLVDPNLSPLRAAPRDAHELMIQASNSHLLCLDNLSRVPENLSDALSRLATGGGFSARELYSDDNEKLFNAQRPILLNGIEDLCTRADLLDRALAIMLPPIPEAAREPEELFWERFEAARGRIFAGLLDVMAAGIAALPGVTLPVHPRMADFARWGTAVEAALGLAPGGFMRAYATNRQSANSVVLDASPVALALCGLMERRAEWQGTATELLAQLNCSGASESRPSGLPGSARALGGALRRIAPNLRADGIGVEFDREASKKRGRIIRIRKAGEFSSELSASSAAVIIPAHGRDAAPTNGQWSDATGPGAASLEARVSDKADDADANYQRPLLLEKRSQNEAPHAVGPGEGDL